MTWVECKKVIPRTTTIRF